MIHVGKTHTALRWLAAYPQFLERLARFAQQTNDEENYFIFDSIKTIAKGGNQNRVANPPNVMCTHDNFVMVWAIGVLSHFSGFPILRSSTYPGNHRECGQPSESWKNAETPGRDSYL